MADLSRPNKDANLHDLPVKRDDAARLRSAASRYYGTNRPTSVGNR